MLFIVARRCCFFFSWEFPSKYFTIIILDNDFKSLKFFFVSFESSVVFILVPFIIRVSMKFDAYFYVQHTPKHKICFYFYTPNQCKLESVTIQCFDLGCCFSRRKKNESVVVATDSKTIFNEYRCISCPKFTNKSHRISFPVFESIKSMKLNVMIVLSITYCDSIRTKRRFWILVRQWNLIEKALIRVESMKWNQNHIISDEFAIIWYQLLTNGFAFQSICLSYARI